jgi:hypothetical protein
VGSKAYHEPIRVCFDEDHSIWPPGLNTDVVRFGLLVHKADLEAYGFLNQSRLPLFRINYLRL